MFGLIEPQFLQNEANAEVLQTCITFSGQQGATQLVAKVQLFASLCKNELS